MKRNSDAKGIVHIYTGLSQLKVCAQNGAIIMMAGPQQIR